MRVAGTGLITPIIMGCSMFCCGISRPDSTHTSVGFNFIRCLGVSDLQLEETICSRSLTCACFLCNSGNESCFLIWDRDQALSLAVWVHFLLSAIYALNLHSICTKYALNMQLCKSVLLYFMVKSLAPELLIPTLPESTQMAVFARRIKTPPPIHCWIL